MQQSIFITAGLSLMLAACATTGTLQSATGAATISGTLTRSLFEPHRVEVILDGRKYHGEWRTGAPTQEQLKAKTLPHKRHFGQVQSVLVADDGSKLDCRWQTHEMTGTGSCSSGSVEYPLILK